MLAFISEATQLYFSFYEKEKTSQLLQEVKRIVITSSVILISVIISSMKIALTTDHAGFDMLKELEKYLVELGHECINFGPKAFDVDDDYPDFMFPAAQAVARGDCERGIIFGGSGQGEAMAANRVKGARCALYYGPVAAKVAINAEGDMSDDPLVILKLSREHNNANMLSLGARFLTMDEVKIACKTWLDAPFPEVERHVRRVKKLDS